MMRAWRKSLLRDAPGGGVGCFFVVNNKEYKLDCPF
jgi:hypothetical protein